MITFILLLSSNLSQAQEFGIPPGLSTVDAVSELGIPPVEFDEEPDIEYTPEYEYEENYQVDISDNSQNISSISAESSTLDSTSTTNQPSSKTMNLRSTFPATTEFSTTRITAEMTTTEFSTLESSTTQFTTTEKTTTEKTTTELELTTALTRPEYDDEEENSDEDLNFNGRLGETEDFFVGCETTQMCLYLRKEFLTDKGVQETEFGDFLFRNGESFDENGMTCNAVDIDTDQNIDSEIYLSFCTYPNNNNPDWSCGTLIDTNDTHISFKNDVSLERGSFAMQIDCECAWETDIYVNDPIGFKINVIKLITVTVPVFDVGKFPVSMHLFKSEEFDILNMYNSPPELELSRKEVEYMFVGIRHLEPINGVTIQVLKLWATPDQNTENLEYYDIVNEQCPEDVNNNQVLEMITGISGLHNFVQYKIPVFKFPSSNRVYLHAAVRICFQDKLTNGETCSATCMLGSNGRKRRGAEELDLSEVVTWGPVYVKEHQYNHGETHFEISTMKKIENSESESFVIQTIIISIMVIIITACVIILATVLKKKFATKTV